jgi:acetyl esterase/lipase
VLAATAAGVVLAGCSENAPSSSPTSSSTRKHRRVRYGDRDDQFADLRLPDGDPKATLVLLHGGYWQPGYGLDLMNPLAEKFTDLGYATWNVEYRHTGDHAKDTLSDVAAAVDRLGQGGPTAGLDRHVVLLGHSAGGHLAAWAASRTADTPGGKPQVAVRGAVSLSGVLDLTRAATDPRSLSPVIAFMGGTPAEEPDAYAVADPAMLVPAACPVWAVHAADDQVVSAEQSTRYVAADRAAGGTAKAVVVPGDHFTLIDPTSAAFPTIRKLVDQAAS